MSKLVEVYEQSEVECMKQFPELERCYDVFAEKIDTKLCLSIMKEFKDCAHKKRDELLDKKGWYRQQLG